MSILPTSLPGARGGHHSPLESLQMTVSYHVGIENWSLVCCRSSRTPNC